MRLGWFKRAQPQNSTAAGYTAAVEAAAWARVNQSLRAERLGVSESCAALIERTLLSAELTGAGKFEMSDLAVGVYHFVRRGEAVLYPVGGQLVVAAGWDVEGESADPGKWRYRLDIVAPEISRVVETEGRHLIHLRHRVSPDEPWRGRGPLENMDGNLLERLERALASEAAHESKKLLQLPQSSSPVTSDQQGSLDDSINSRLRPGRIGVIKAADGEYGAAANPRADLTEIRVNPVAAAVELRRDLRLEVCGCFGVPPSMLGYVGGDSQRAGRQFHSTTILPMARAIERELKRLWPQAAISFVSERAVTDVAALARAYKSLREAGMTDKDAREAAGLD